MSAEGSARADHDRVRKLVDAAIRAHKLAPTQREWAEAFAERDPDSFEQFMAITPDYFEDRVNALTDVFLTRARLAAKREDGEEIGPDVFDLMGRMKRLADQLTEDIETGLLEPRFAADRDYLLEEVKRFAKRLPSIDPLVKRQGGRPRITDGVARERLLVRFGGWRAHHDVLRDNLTREGLARVAPICDSETITNDLERAGWVLDDVEVEWDRRARKRRGATTL